MKDIIKKYSNEEITIVWKPALCIHSTKCWKGEGGLLNVFNPSKKPWINPVGAETTKIIERVNNCPSGALSFYENNTKNESAENIPESIVEVSPNGPLLVHGNLLVKDNKGNQTKRSKVTAFCRCGASSTKPFCDGTHQKIQFEG